MVTPEIPLNHFDRSKPFYPLIVTYSAALHGLVELASRRTVRVATALVEAGECRDGPPTLHVAGATEVTEERLREFYSDPTNRGATPLIAPLNLRCEVDGTTIPIDIDELAAEVFENAYYLIPGMAHAAGMLIVSAWEAAKPVADKSPICEFLRHCRNAAGHGGRFNLVRAEPTRPAAWQSLKITRSLQGMPLFKGYTGVGLLSPGDPLRLLCDIERALPDLTPDLVAYPDDRIALD